MKISRRADRKIEVYQQELIKTHFAEVDNMYRRMRGWRHDYRNHIQVLKAYADRGDLQAVIEYLKELEADLYTVDTVIKTGNPMTDAILNSKIALAGDRGIRVEADAHIPALLNFSAVDLCTILANLFDNAIEASAALPPERRVIRVYMDMKGVQLYISFLNFTNGGKLKKAGSVFKSTKGGEHGLGMGRIESVVKKLGGYLSVNSEDGAFTTEILLPEALN
ncbi:MAG: GHKL domain-containing protein [Butyrivibrio sp.]|nr:GHKL domain-containing protein [Ruminococcus flavefaciens]MCM1560878.1 GHKL domain-containing protein [Butyrivibrio sp.]